MPRDSQVNVNITALNFANFDSLSTALAFATAQFNAYSTYFSTTTVPRDWPPFTAELSNPELRPDDADKTDAPVTITIKPAKLRHKRRIE